MSFPRLCLLLLSVAAFHSRPCGGSESLEQGWGTPPVQARLRAYWWWLNGNVTKAAITRDLEQMKAQGFGGALICDAGGAEQDGNDQVPHGPTFMTEQWRDLYRHALQEGERLGLEMSLNIQSGWNLGGPNVTADDAAKKLVWAETQWTGPRAIAEKLPVPEHRDGYYRDLFVVAFPLNPQAKSDRWLGVTANSEASDHRAIDAADGDEATFWVSSGSQPGEGPTAERPQWLQLNFRESIEATSLTLRGRAGYGPRECVLRVSSDGRKFREIKKFAVPEREPITVDFPPSNGLAFRLTFPSAYDPRYPDRPRNVQVAEVTISSQERTWPDPSARRPIANWAEKALYKALSFSAPDTSPLLTDVTPRDGEQDTRSRGVIDLSDRLQADGALNWDVPEGNWTVLRFGCTIGNHSTVSTSSEGWKGYALDVLDAGALQRYWDAVVEPLIADAGPRAGRTLKYLHTDSWEVEALNWTPTLREEFRKRRGYDFIPLLPVMAGRIVDSRESSNRFLNDYRRTIGDLAVDHHYRPFVENAHRHGLQIHPESGGPHAVPIDAQQCLGQDDMPMSEFWAESWRHRIGDMNRFFVKQPASAAHTYGHRFVAAEGFTTIGPHWQETLWDNLKPSFDRACCEGLNLLVWHAFVCSPEEMGMPGIQYFAGTHFNPNSTWWSKSGPFLAYINRCQWMLQQGQFVADACYYYGDHVPNFAQLKRTDPAKVLPGFDYDVVTEEVLLNRMAVRDGQLVLPDGMSYRVLVLPERRAISLRVLRKVRELVEKGATVVGPRPETATTLADYPACDAEVKSLATALWGDGSEGVPLHKVGNGRVAGGLKARDLLIADGVQPDFESASESAEPSIDYIHRVDGKTHIYFVTNLAKHADRARCTFRVADLAPELWNPVTGEHDFAAAYDQEGGRITVPLEFAPCGSWFIVFRAPAAAHPPQAATNRTDLSEIVSLTGPWQVKFSERWGGPASVQFDELVSWTKRPEEGIRHYSGTALYEKSFVVPADAITPAPSKSLRLDLGVVHELAEVRLNGKSLGIVWAPPFQVDITSAVQSGENKLEIEVVNFWPNRIIGDQFQPENKRLTRTNVRKLDQKTALMESGLFGPVRILKGETAAQK